MNVMTEEITDENFGMDGGNDGEERRTEIYGHNDGRKYTGITTDENIRT